MSREYERRRAPARGGSGGGRLFGWVAAFLAGYLAATVFDVASLSGWVRKQLLHEDTTAQPQAVARNPKAPKPKFEFYTLLPKGQTVLPKVPAPAMATPAPAPAAQPATRPQLVPSVPPVANTKPVSPAVPAASVPVTESKPVAPATKTAETATGNYMLQLAAFRSRQDAERLKATLALRGIYASVVTVNQQAVTWFRVVAGPFNQRDQAVRVQESVYQSEKVRGIIIRSG